MPTLSKSLCDALNEQINRELSSAYLYLFMSARCASRNLPGTAHWLRKQSEEELAHALKLLDYVLERGNAVDLKMIEEPDLDFKSLTEAFEKLLKHEQEVTVAISKLFEKAAHEPDHAAQIFLQWFVTEQVEEEKTALEVLQTLKAAGEAGAVLLMLDRQLGQRAS